MSTHKELVALFEELTELMSLQEGGAQSFRVRAYENATEAIKSSRDDLATMKQSALTKLEGIGKSTAQKIREYFDTGSIKKLEELRELFPTEFVALTRIPGLGPKTLLRLRDELGVHNLENLREAIAGQKIRALKGMGAKSEEKLAKAIERMGSKQDRRPIGEALPLAEAIVEELAEREDVLQVQFAGSLRRFRETIADIDIVVAAHEARAIMEFFVSMPRVKEVLAHGDTKSSIVSSSGFQVDLRVVEEENYGAALLYFTGSKAHNIRLRQRALDQGATLNEYGLVELGTEEVLACKSEEEIYAALGLSWIPPQMREDWGEVESASKKALPHNVEEDEILGDLHVHTDYSGDARSPLEDMIKKAKSRGYHYLAITDHGQELRANGIDQAAHSEIAAKLEKLRPKYKNMLILHGCELNMDAEGNLDYSPEERAAFDLCLASIHSHFDLPADKQTKRILRAMEEPKVRILGHLTARSIGKRPGIELEVDTVLKAAKERDIAIEINSGLKRLDAPADILKRATELGCLFALNSDAHHADHMDGIRFGVAQSIRGWVPRESIVNTWPLEKFRKWALG